MSSDVPLAIGLLSGGLDSALACKLLLAQGLRVVAFNLTTPFCTCGRKGGCGARGLAERLGLEYVAAFGGDDYIEVVRKPRWRRGSAMNPCLDCRIYTLSRARELMEERGAAFCFTGEVVGQRPMSQQRDQLALVEREAGLEGRLLRPLSAQLLPPTAPEREGLVAREKLLALRGRSRKAQLALAGEFGLAGFACPAGGCLLTDKDYGARLADAFARDETSLPEMALLRLGRHFRLPAGAKVVIGRREEENAALAASAREGDYLIEIADVGSPLVLLRGSRGEGDLPTAAALALVYSDARDREEAPALVKRGDEAFTVTARRGDAEGREGWRLRGR